MAITKRGTTPKLRVTIDTLEHAGIHDIQFLFKQIESECAETILEKEYPGNDVAYDSEDDSYLIYLTEEESRLFKEERWFYMDTKVTMTNGDIPPTTIEKIYCKKTLFHEDEDND